MPLFSENFPIGSRLMSTHVHILKRIDPRNDVKLWGQTGPASVSLATQKLQGKFHLEPTVASSGHGVVASCTW